MIKPSSSTEPDRMKNKVPVWHSDCSREASQTSVSWKVAIMPGRMPVIPWTRELLKSLASLFLFLSPFVWLVIASEAKQSPW